MSWTQDDLDTLEAAISKGASQVRVGDEQVTLRSLPEMLRTRDLIKRELAGSAASSMQVYPKFVARPV